ncbi:FAD-dependent monooxygenase [Agaribacter flavus]|uniref:FAD-dependent monooxygenase n=1 Tax=Agaribacter flavus TaxID=1902781 RepID=A0ABV7FNS5_9ALTE
MLNKDIDIIIAGGGVVACVAALAISKLTDFSVAIIEKHPPKQNDLHPSFDAKVIALARQTIKQLSEFDIELNDIDMGLIEAIHISDRKHIGQTHLDAKKLGFSYFGKVVRLEELGLSLYSQLKSQGIDYISPDCITDISVSKEKVTATTENHVFSAKLLVIAEGANSPTRDLLKLPVKTYDYQQTAIVSNVRMQMPHNNHAYERFTKYGPLAFLPMQLAKGEHWMSVVWTLPNDRTSEILALEEDTFCAQLQSLFGYRLGNIKASSARFSYPLMLKEATSYTHHRVICIGNAAQSLHPIAGQGFNLGIRDVANLLISMTTKNDSGKQASLGSFAQIKHYRVLCDSDKQMTIGATDSLVHMFSNHFEPLVIGRNAGLFALNHSESLKRKFSKVAMGERY